MPRFVYTAINAQGKTLKGNLTAENPFSARKQLRARNIHPTDIKEVSSASEASRSILSVFSRSPRRELLEFTKQLSTLLNADIKLTDALSVLSGQINDVRFRNAIIDIRDRVITGESFTDTISDYTDFFDVIYISMVRVGEVTGTLDKSLSKISDFMEKRQRNESKMITVMIYPILLSFICLGAVVFLTTVVIPKITDQIAKTGQELPMITKILMGFSDMLRFWWWLVIIVIGLAIWGIKKFFQSEKGSYIRDKTLLSLPIFGVLIRQRVVARFSSTLSTLLGSGLSMAESLRVVAEVTGNAVMNRSVRQARDRIMSGADIATPLRDGGVIDPATAHMISVGEKSGELETMLRKISENLESSSDMVIERLSAAVEPLIIIVMAAIVGVIVYAVFSPILQLSSGKGL